MVAFVLPHAKSSLWSLDTKKKKLTGTKRVLARVIFRMKMNISDACEHVEGVREQEKENDERGINRI